MTEERSFQGSIQKQEEPLPGGEAEETFLRELIQLEADIEKEEASLASQPRFERR
jgi:hypothetical protein